MCLLSPDWSFEIQKVAPGVVLETEDLGLAQVLGAECSADD